MKALLLSAGFGTRVREIREDIPKVLIPIAGKPIILWNLELLKKYNIKNIAINTHYMADKIKKYLGNGKKYGVDIVYSYEKELLGTAGALANFREFFDDTFIIIYGDIITEIDLGKLNNFHKNHNAIGTLVVHETNHPEDSDIIQIDEKDNIVNLIHKPGSDIFGRLGNAAIYVLEPDIFDYIDSTPCDFIRDIFPKMLKDKKKLVAYNTNEFIRDAGTSKRIFEIEKRLKTASRAVFLDRDGIINEEVMTKNINDIKLLDKAPEALKILKEKGFKLIVITNQPIIARGLASEEEIKTLHNKINEKIHQLVGVKIDKFYFCPHHPNATIKKYRKNCNCRKPFPGMIQEAAKDFDLTLHDCWMIGDRITDIIAGKNAGCKTLIIESPHNQDFIESSKPYDKKTKPDYRASSLLDSLKFIA